MRVALPSKRGPFWQADVSGAVFTWEWRRGQGAPFVTPDGVERRFHAYDVNDNAACRPMWGLIQSIEEPNEGSNLCPECMAVIKAEPAGREPHPGRNAEDGL